MSSMEVAMDGPGKAFMICNEAIVRGALEADVKVVSEYPGSPTTEILDTFSEISPKFDFRMEISVNEKVALETCAGASMVGLRSMTAMKSVGMNVASDSFFSLSYTGVKGGMVVVVADDPHAHSSQTEQDGRPFGPNAYVPMLEPSDPAEAKRMVKSAFELSEKYSVPVLIRTTTRVNHQSGIVELEKLDRKPFAKIPWTHPPGRYVTVAEAARQFKHKLLDRTRLIEQEFEASDLNMVKDTGSDLGIVTVGAGYNYAVDAVRTLGINPSILKLGTTYPLPKKLIGDFLKKLKTVVVVEELQPYLELHVTAIAKDANPSIKIYGKWTGHFSESLEYNPNIVVDALAKVVGRNPPVDYSAIMAKAKEMKAGLPDRWPTFCPGCPHRATLHALKQAAKGMKHILSTDIGCYSMSFLDPINYGDSLLSMGACLGVAAGMQYAAQEKVVAMIGDSTFWHAGLPGLVNAIHHGDDFTLVILDNEVTAMTGQQPDPGRDYNAGGQPAKPLILEDVIKAMGISDITIVDPYQVKAAVEPMKQALSRKGPNVIISRRACALYADRNKRGRGEVIQTSKVDKNVCKKPYTCIREFYCPAISIDDEDRKAFITKELCDRCGVCAKLCPFGSIKLREGD
ncbi:MAG: indolepyruvate ferredoxin oxidoreductase subunit alpha [Thermoplasmatota archaeon]|nr:indolepyruvate ferredoxin oxidoreductase subunit alpha [Candidatus Thermoplasmatota archaeon]